MTLADRMRRFFASAPHRMDAVWLFGSRARGEARSDSDVDVAVLFSEPRPQGFEGLPLDLEADLEDALGLHVQVVDVERAPADLVHRVLRDGVLLLDRRPSRRIAVEVRRRNEYWDLEPIRRAFGRSEP